MYSNVLQYSLPPSVQTHTAHSPTPLKRSRGWQKMLDGARLKYSIVLHEVLKNVKLAGGREAVHSIGHVAKIICINCSDNR